MSTGRKLLQEWCRVEGGGLMDGVRRGGEMEMEVEKVVSGLQEGQELVEDLEGGRIKEKEKRGRAVDSAGSRDVCCASTRLILFTFNGFVDGQVVMDRTQR